MTFRELFWAHLLHRNNKWSAIWYCVLFGIGMFSLIDKEVMSFQTFGMCSYFAVLMTCTSAGYAAAKISPFEQNRAKEFYWQASWWSYWLVTFLPTTWMLLVMWWLISVSWMGYVVVAGILAVLADSFWRSWRLKNQSKPRAKSHFRGREHHSSKTIR